MTVDYFVGLSVKVFWHQKVTNKSLSLKNDLMVYSVYFLPPLLWQKKKKKKHLLRNDFCIK